MVDRHVDFPHFIFHSHHTHHTLVVVFGVVGLRRVDDEQAPIWSRVAVPYLKLHGLPFSEVAWPSSLCSCVAVPSLKSRGRPLSVVAWPSLLCSRVAVPYLKSRGHRLSEVAWNPLFQVQPQVVLFKRQLGENAVFFAFRIFVVSGFFPFFRCSLPYFLLSDFSVFFPFFRCSWTTKWVTIFFLEKWIWRVNGS